MFFKIDIFKYFARFKGRKQWVLFYYSYRPTAWSFIKEEALVQVFFCEIFKNILGMPSFNREALDACFLAQSMNTTNQ